MQSNIYELLSFTRKHEGKQYALDMSPALETLPVHIVDVMHMHMFHVHMHTHIVMLSSATHLIERVLMVALQKKAAKWSASACVVECLHLSSHMTISSTT